MGYMRKATCEWETGCTRPVKYISRGLCEPHYQHARWKGLLDEKYPTKQTTCTCGQVVKVGTANNIKHRQSLLHRHPKALALIRANKIDYCTLAKRLGVSRERVRQIAKKLGVTGRQRQALERQKRLETKGVAWVNQRSKHPAIREALRRGLDVRVTPWVQALSINGRSVILRKTNFHRHYVSFKPAVNNAADFCIWPLPNGSFLIMPRADWPKGKTAFSLEPKANMGAKLYRHDYRKYINAWDLLTKGVAHDSTTSRSEARHHNRRSVQAAVGG